MLSLQASVKSNIGGKYHQIEPTPIKDFTNEQFYYWIVLAFAIHAPGNIFTNPEYKTLLLSLDRLRNREIPFIMIKFLKSNAFIYINWS